MLVVVPVVASGNAGSGTSSSSNAGSGTSSSSNAGNGSRSCKW